MGRSKKKNNNHPIKQQVEFKPPQIQSTSLQTTSFSQLPTESTVKSQIKQTSKVTPKSDSEFSVSDFQDEVYKMTVNFTMKQWLTLGMSRIIPHNDRNIVVSPKRNEVSGPKDKVERFCQLAEKEIQSKIMKVFKFKYDISSEEIRFQMGDLCRYQIFSVDLLKKVSEKIQAAYDIKIQMQEEMDSILSKDGINKYTRFLWVQNESYEKAFQILQKIHKQRKIEMEEQQKTEETSKSFTKLLDQLSQDNSFKSQEKKNEKPAENSRLKTAQNYGDSQDSEDFSKVIKKNQNKKGTDDRNPIISQSHINSKNQNPYEDIMDDSNFTTFEPRKNTSYVAKKNSNQPAMPNRQGRRRNQGRPAQQDRVGGQQQRRGNREPLQQKIIFTQEYPEQYFDKNQFRHWAKHNKTLKHLDSKQIEINQKFSPQEGITYCEVVIYGQDPKRDKKYAIDLYFNHQKIIKIQEEDAEVRDKIINKFKCSNVWLRIEHKKVYTREKFPKFETLRHEVKKDNSAKYMNKNKNLHHVLLAVGLISEVASVEAEINQFLKQVRNTCRRVDIQLKFKKLNEFMRKKEMFELIQKCVTEYLSHKSEKSKLVKIHHILTEVSVQVELLNVPDKDLDRTKEELIQRLESLIDSFEFDLKKFKHPKKIFQGLSGKFIIFENSKQGVTLIAKAKQIKEQMLEINQHLQKSNENLVKQFTVKQKSELSICRDFITKKLREQQISNVQVRYEEGAEWKIVFIGPTISVTDLISLVEEFYENIEGKICEYNIDLTDEQLQIIEKDKSIQKHIESTWKITLKYKPDYNLGAVFLMQPHGVKGVNFPVKQIYFQKQFNFQQMPENSIFYFRSEKQMESVKQPFILPLKNHVQSKSNGQQPVYYQDKIKSCFYIFKSEAQPSTILSSSKQTFNNFNRIFMYLPQTHIIKDKFVKVLMDKICEDKELLGKEIDIIFVCKKNIDLKKILLFKQGKTSYKSKVKRIWYTLEGDKKLFYSQIGNNKIEQAIKKGLMKVQLNNEDLNLTIKTHKFNFQNKTMTHMASGVALPIQIYSNRITFTLNGEQKTIPDSEFQNIPKQKTAISLKEQFTDCDLSIGFYKVDFIKKTQINLFSNYSRNIGNQVVQQKTSQNYDLEVNYDVKTSKLGLQYSHQNQNSVKKAEIYIKNTLESKLITKTKPFGKQFTPDLIQKFENDAQQQNISIETSQDGKSLILKAYNEKKIENFLRIVSHLAKTEKKEVPNPQEWAAQQQQIQTFVVPANTIEFKKVQTAFTAGKITELIRIQNKIVFRKFYEEKMFLKELNGGKQVKEMLLYHGTRATDPKLIYEDKQECFNINYTGQSNLLGKGTYFAEKPEYSVNYSFSEDQNNITMSMFYCRVLVGDSEKCPGHNGNIRDTSFKDHANHIRYESMTDFLSNSNIFVVYKNRRAYPLYLIKFKKN